MRPPAALTHIGSSVSGGPSNAPATNSRRLPQRIRCRELWLHTYVYVRRTRLDQALTAGADPASSRQLALRASQLTKQAHRDALAQSLEGLIALAENPRPRHGSAVPPARREVLAARAALLNLCRTLRDGAPVQPAGIVLTGRLLTDGCSPLYLETHENALWNAARTATATLTGEA